MGECQACGGPMLEVGGDCPRCAGWLANVGRWLYHRRLEFLFSNRPSGWRSRPVVTVPPQGGQDVQKRGRVRLVRGRMTWTQ